MIRALLTLAPLLAMALALAVSQTAFAQTKGTWLRAETRHFTFYSDGSEEELRNLARQAERFDALLRRHFGVPASADPRRLDVYMLRSGKQVAQMMKERSLAGFYSASSEGSFIVTNRGWTMGGLDLTGQITLFHEYAHHFMYRHLSGAWPAWYREGFAEYVSTVTFEEDGSWTLGRPAQHRMHAVLTRQIPLETLFSGRLDGMESRERATFYAWSWLLVHLLMTDSSRAGQLDAYLDCVAGPDAQTPCATRAFGDPAALEATLLRYRSQDFEYRRSAAPLSFDETIKLARLDPLQSQLTQLALLRRTRRQPDAARDGLAKLAEANPDNPQILFHLALAERDLSARADDAHLAAAEALAGQVLALDPGFPRALALSAELAARRLHASGDVQSGEWAALRARLATASRFDPQDPLPRYLLYRSYFLQRQRPADAAFAAMDQSFAMMPEVPQVRITQALALALRGRFEDAETIAGALVADPHSSALGQRALAHLARLRAATAAQTPPQAPLVRTIGGQSAERDDGA